MVLVVLLLPQVTEDDIVRNLRFLEQHRRELPIDTVQIDDGYQADIGDWLTVNEKFPKAWRWLASEIKAAGYTPGLWLAPFFVVGVVENVCGHPEWVVRDTSGEPSPRCTTGSAPTTASTAPTLRCDLADGASSTRSATAGATTT